MNFLQKVSAKAEKVEADFGYGKNIDVTSLSFSQIKKAILESHKASKFSDKKLGKITLSKPSSSHSKTFSECYLDYDIEADGVSVKALVHCVMVASKNGNVKIRVQTRYNQA